MLLSGHVSHWVEWACESLGGWVEWACVSLGGCIVEWACESLDGLLSGHVSH